MASTDASSEPQTSTASADAASTAADGAAGGGSGAGVGGSGSITEMSAEQFRALFMQVQRVDPIALRQAALGGGGTPADQEKEEGQSGSAVAAAAEVEGKKDAEEKVEVSNAPNEDGADTEERTEAKDDQSEKKTKKKNSDKQDDAWSAAGMMVASVEELMSTLSSKEQPMPTEETPGSQAQQTPQRYLLWHLR